ncbi:two-component system response regulator [Nitrospira sp.]|nr:two-component system response regulator [Nitrospira sp.]
MTSHISRPQPIALVADDDLTVRLLTRQVLEQAGLLVEEAGSGDEAVAIFKRLAPDIVLLDVMMPGMDGFETCHALRHLPGGSHVPILIMTGLDDVDSIEKAYDMGATDFISKPWQVLILSNRVRYMLRTARIMNALRESQTNLARAQHLAGLGTWTWKVATDQLTLSEEMYRILGVSLGEFANTWDGYMALVHPEDEELVRQSMGISRYGQRTSSIDYRIRRPDGSERIVTEHVEPVIDEQGLTCAVNGTVQDITDRRMAETQLFLSTYYDTLTNLPNQQLFKDRVGKTVLKALERQAIGALLLVNMDQFRHINDVHGMSRGDEVLKLMSDRLKECLRKDDLIASGVSIQAGSTLARLVGDTFALCLSDMSSERDAAKVARRLLAALHRPIGEGDTHMVITASIGITVFPQDGSDIDMLVKNAESALQSAKAKGGDRFEYFVKEMDAAAEDRQALEQDLRHAMEHRELALHYQPQVDIKRWSISAVEAFVRWHHPTRGIVPPSQFVPLAEGAGLGVALGEWVIRTACAQQKAWRLAGTPAIRVSVNLSDYHVRQQTLVEIISLAVQDIGPTPDLFEVELTEGAIMHDLAHSMKLLKRLKSLGIRIAVDDFGAGSSSLRELSRLPIDTIKIAPSFVHHTVHPSSQNGITAAVIGLGHGLRCRVVAKNVETQQQLDVLRSLGCDDIQGHLYGAAEPAERIAQMLTNKSQGSRRLTAA